MVVQAENRCLIVISPQPQQHPWVAAISASEDIMKGFEEVYPGGVWIGGIILRMLAIMVWCLGLVTLPSFSLLNVSYTISSHKLTPACLPLA